MKKIFLYGFIALVLLFVLGTWLDDEDFEEDIDTGEALNEQSQESASNEQESWVFYWYLCGSDLESEAGFASQDIEEVLAAKLPDNVKIVFLAGGADHWNNDFDSEYMTLGVINNKGLEVIEKTQKRNMGDPNTLINFLDYCNKNYKADKKALLFWNHGGGSISGFAFDKNYDLDSITLDELEQALKKTADGKYEMIGFDTCLMATIDTARACHGYAEYMVASQEVEPGGGWNYEAWLNSFAKNTGISGEQLGEIICDTYYDTCYDMGFEDQATLSVVKLDNIPKLLTLYDAVGLEALLSASIDDSYINNFSRMARNVENYGGNSRSEGYTNMVDLGELVKEAGDEGLLEDTYNELLETLEQVVVYKRNGYLRDDSSGLSCYYAYDGDYNNYSQFAELNSSEAFSYYFDYMLTGEPNEDILEYLNHAIDTKYMEDFDRTKYDADIQASFKILDDLTFIENKENIILIGTPGSGKTHYAIAMGIKAWSY